MFTHTLRTLSSYTHTHLHTGPHTQSKSLHKIGRASSSTGSPGLGYACSLFCRAHVQLNRWMECQRDRVHVSSVYCSVLEIAVRNIAMCRSQVSSPAACGRQVIVTLSCMALLVHRVCSQRGGKCR